MEREKAMELAQKVEEDKEREEGFVIDKLV